MVHSVKVRKDLVERYFNYYPETKSVTDRWTWASLYTPAPLLVELGYKEEKKIWSINAV
jgi:hypothetical protein